MAGDWLKFESTLPEKQEVLAITVTMGWDDPDLTVGKLMRLFRWFDQQTLNGNAPGVSPALLDRVLGAPGFCNAVAKEGWLVVQESGLSLNNFERHNGATAKSRALTAKRVANHKTNALGNAMGNGDSVSEALPREEKNREEKNREEIKDKGAVALRSVPSREEEPDGSMSPAKLPTCPTQEIIDLYHRILPTLPVVRLLGDKRKRAIAGFWRFVLTTTKTSGTEGLDWINQFFRKADQNDFLMGRTSRSSAHAGWQCDIDFLMSEKGRIQVLEKTDQNTNWTDRAIV